MEKISDQEIIYSPGALLFNAACNEQVFSSNPLKKWRRFVLSFSRKTQKTHF